MKKCADTPELTYTNGTNFTIWFGGQNRARVIAQRHGNRLARNIIRQHNRDHCDEAECDETYANDTGTYHHRCAAGGVFKIAMQTKRTFKTWFGGIGGDYAIGVEGKVQCECVIPRDIGQPFDFLGLVNIVGGVSKSTPENLKSLADLIKWMTENLGED